MIRSTTPGTCAHAGGQVPPAREKLPVILRGFSVAPNHPGTQAWTMSTRRMETQGNRCHGETADPPGFQERGLKPPPPALGPGGEGCHALVPPIGSRPQRSQLPGSEDVCLASSPQAAVVQPLGLRAHVLPALLLCCLFLAPWFWQPTNLWAREKELMFKRQSKTSSAFSENTMKSQRQWDNKQLRELHAHELYEQGCSA